MDWIIVAFVTLLAVFGYGQGFLVGALSLVGFCLGAFLGSRIGPELLSEGARSPYAPVFALGGAVLVGGLFALGLETVGRALRSALVIPGLGVLDGLLGALLSGIVALGLAWVFGAVALQTPGARELRRDVQRSEILSRLYAALPPGEFLNLLARFDPFPRISGPQPDVSPPDSAIARDPDVRAAADSIVRVTGTACGLGVAGSGWVAGNGLVVTNAHVVAGQDDTVVQVGGAGDELEADAVAYDPRNDVAVLRVDGLGAPPLPVVDDPAAGTSGAILGFPENGPYDVRPVRIGPTTTVRSQDSYGRGPISRSMTAIRGVVRSGNSGGPVVDGRGRVLTTVFAATVGTRLRGGYGVPNSVVRDALAGARGTVDTGPCAR
ncbi:MAG TPA: MarP family serine protease [Solirubrobacteraceae bacterium]|nr:MarP family serine protease [Solirubrobacteraceae bacterium]